MTAQKITVNDIGITLRVTFQENDAALDVSTSTAKRILLQAPDGTIDTYTASYFTDGSDGKIEYKTIAVLAKRGTWKFRGQVEFSASEVYYSPAWEEFEVEL